MEVEQPKGQWELLPINNYRESILKAVQENEVVVVEGQTGCGKTTQVPKYILEAQPKSRIIVTQPRRLAAISVANRVAHETGSKLGGRIGYHIGMDCCANDRTSITYVTNGIFLQKLTNDPEFLKSYTHFIFDEIHERGLECDFSIIAMKLYLCRKAVPGAKIVLMSATLNSELFRKFFAKDMKGCFIKARIIEERDERARQSRGRGRGQRQLNEQDYREWKYTTKLDVTQKDKLAACIKLPTMRKHTITIKYLQDVEQKKREYNSGYNDEPDMSDSLLDTAAKIVGEYYQRGDILIFVPGMRQIKKLSDWLENFKSKCNVIELHSQYSETAYEQLFSRDGRAKVIISTNIAESSITLPDCKTVIDFCMSKQNNYDERTRFQRLELKWASHASLTQRAGRVGRVSDGMVFRLIPRGHMDRFAPYESPEIRRSPLQKTILQIKKLEKLDSQSRRKQQGEGSIFQNPYEVLSNAFEPPEIESINAAIDRLVDEGALVIDPNEDYQDPEFRSMKYNGCSLKITKLGELLVQIPCDIQLAKGLLLSMELSCFDHMLNVAAILYSTKPFFVNSDKRQQPEQYIHTIIDYDRGQYNDFRLRHRIFESWQTKFFVPWYNDNVNKYFTNKRLEDIDDQDENMYKAEGTRVINYTKMLNEFQRQRAYKQQIRWCTMRCVYANNLRENLLFRESLRMKITKGRMNFRDRFITNERILDMALNICLFSAFRDSLMLIECNPDDSGVNSFRNQQMNPMYSIDVPLKYQQYEKQVKQYIVPEEDPKLRIVEMSQSFFLESSYPILSKFMLPYRHKGRLNGESTEVFRMLFGKQPYYSYNMRVKDLRNRTEVRVDNDSINGFIPHRGIHQGYLICNGYFESRSNVSTGCTAYLDAASTILLLMIFNQKAELQHHASHEYFKWLKLKNYSAVIPIFLDKILLERISKLKQHIKEIFELGTRDAMNDQLMRDFREVLDQDYDYIPSVDEYWEKLHIEQAVKQIELQPDQEIGGIRFKPVLNQRRYHQDYNEWRTRKLLRFQEFANGLRFESVKFICRDCHPNKTTVLCQADSCDPKKNVFNFNRYDDSWHVQGTDVMCSTKKHRLGRMKGEEEVEIQEQRKLLLLYPDLTSEGFTFSRFDLKEVKDTQERVLRRVREQRRSIRNFDCPFCLKEDNPFKARNLADFMKHIRSKEHSRKMEQFAHGLR